MWHISNLKSLKYSTRNSVRWTSLYFLFHFKHVVLCQNKFSFPGFLPPPPILSVFVCLFLVLFCLVLQCLCASIVCIVELWCLLLGCVSSFDKHTFNITIEIYFILANFHSICTLNSKCRRLKETRLTLWRRNAKIKST